MKFYAQSSKECTLSEFLTFIETLKLEKQFRERVKKLCSFFSKIGEHCWTLWIKDGIAETQKSMRIILEERSWYSNLTSEQDFMNGLGKKYCTPCRYFFLRMYEEGHDGDESKPLISLRADKRGEYGELVWLQKASQAMSGTSTYDLFQKIDDALSVRVMFLHDDAKFIMNGSVAKGRQDCEIYLKMLRSVAIDQSWYQSRGYQPLTIPPYTWKVQGQFKKYYHQSATDFQIAIGKVQETPLDKLHPIYMANENLKKKWDSLFLSLGGDSPSSRSSTPVLPQPIGRLETRPMTRSKSRSKNDLTEKEVPKIIGWRRRVKFKFKHPPHEVELEANKVKYPVNVKDVMHHVYRLSRIHRRGRVRNQKRKRMADDVLKRAYEMFLVRKIGILELPADEFLKEYEGHLEKIEQTKVFARIRKGQVPILVHVKREAEEPPDRIFEYPTPKKRKKRPRTETSGRLEGVKRKRSNQSTLPPLTKRRRLNHTNASSSVPQAVPIRRPLESSIPPLIIFGKAFCSDIFEEVLRLTNERILEVLTDPEMIGWISSYPYNIHQTNQPDHMREIISDAIRLIESNRPAPKFMMRVYRDAASSIIQSSQFPPEKFVQFLPKCIEIEQEGESDTVESNSPPNTPPQLSIQSSRPKDGGTSNEKKPTANPSASSMDEESPHPRTNSSEDYEPAEEDPFHSLFRSNSSQRSSIMKRSRKLNQRYFAAEFTR